MIMFIHEIFDPIIDCLSVDENSKLASLRNVSLVQPRPGLRCQKGKLGFLGPQYAGHIGILHHVQDDSCGKRRGGEAEGCLDIR